MDGLRLREQARLVIEPLQCAGISSGRVFNGDLDDAGTRFDFERSAQNRVGSPKAPGITHRTDRQAARIEHQCAAGAFRRQVVIHFQGVAAGASDPYRGLYPPQASGRQAKQVITLRQGIDTPMAKQIVKLIKDSKLKVQAAIQGEQVRVTGKKRDDLQDAIAVLRASDLDLPLQFTNFRD